ncbi:MAG: hypothetical protein RL173_3510 [Fibrobacterota bacterium]|jgi:omega-amidase
MMLPSRPRFAVVGDLAGLIYGVPMDQLRLGMLQYDPVWCEISTNQRKVEALFAAGPEADLLVLPEMSLTGFCMDSSRAHLDAVHHEWFAELAREHQTGIVYGCVEQGCNRSVLIDRSGARLGIYDKRHLFGLGGEPSSYRPGVETPVWHFEDWRIRPSICYDLRFSYHYWESATEIDLALVPACWPASREAHWRLLLAARAVENQFYVAGVNRIGVEPQLQYVGASLLVDPNGAVLCDARSEEGIFVNTISLEVVKRQRARFPFLRDRVET